MYLRKQRTSIFGFQLALLQNIFFIIHALLHRVCWCWQNFNNVWNRQRLHKMYIKQQVKSRFNDTAKTFRRHPLFQTCINAQRLLMVAENLKRVFKLQKAIKIVVKGMRAIWYFGITLFPFLLQFCTFFGCKQVLSGFKTNFGLAHALLASTAWKQWWRWSE